MPVSPTTLKRLFARSGNRCAMPRCSTVLVNGEHVLAEICHIRARRKGGPRYDPTLSADDRDGFANLLLFCPTCHTLADKDQKTYPVDILTRIKAAHEGQAAVELTTSVIDQALRILAKISERKSAKAVAKGRAVAVAIGGDNHAPINIKTGGDSGIRGWWYEARLLQAAALARSGSLTQARTLYESVAAEASDLRQVAFDCHAGLGKVLLAQHDVDAARRQFELALQSTDAEREALPADELRSAIGVEAAEVHDALIEISLASGDPAEVLTNIERGRARALAHGLVDAVDACVAEAYGLPQAELETVWREFETDPMLRRVQPNLPFAKRRRLGLRTGLTASDRFSRAYRTRSQTW